MSDNARRKERQRLKRKQKQQALRKQRNVSVFRRLESSDAPIQCFINSGWEESPQASIFVLREIPSGGGGHALASFLVDFGVLGLKDAWGRLDMTPLQFRDEILAPCEETMPMERVDPQTARRLIAGAIRYRHDNGFKQVHRLDRWLAILGGVGDWRQADVSEFEPEFAESPEYLHRHLIGCTPEQFLSRPDLSVVFRDEYDPFWEDAEERDQAEEDHAQLMDATIHSAQRAMTGWCQANGQTPHPQLEKALELFFTAAADALQPEDLEGDATEETRVPAERTQASLELLSRELTLRDDLQEADVRSAFEQVHQFAKSFGSTKAFLEAIHGGDKG
jgi:hypothetical protein